MQISFTTVFISVISFPNFVWVDNHLLRENHKQIYGNQQIFLCYCSV